MYIGYAKDKYEKQLMFLLKCNDACYSFPTREFFSH